MAKAAKGSARWWTKRLDKLWAEAVRAKGACEKCGRRPPAVQLQADHIVSRTKRTLRWSVRNGCCLCVRCHLYWKHKEPLEFADWIRAVRPEDVAHIEALQYQLSHYGPADYEAIEAELKTALEERGDVPGGSPPRSSRADKEPETNKEAA